MELISVQNCSMFFSLGLDLADVNSFTTSFVYFVYDVVITINVLHTHYYCLCNKTMLKH